MENTKTKTKISTITLILLLTMSSIIVLLPVIFAQTPVYSKATHCYVGATPNPIGVNQQVLIHVGMYDELERADKSWIGLTATIRRPDGETETLGPFNTDSTGGTGTIYVPTMVGEYILQTHFPAQWFNWTRYPAYTADVYYEASVSEEFTLVVQQTPIEYYSGHQLPTEYWSRPVDAQLREWAPIAGNFLESVRYEGPYTPYNEAPDTGHILWAEPLEFGGLVGGELGDHSYDHGDAYEGKFAGSVVINGVLFYNDHEARGGTNIEHNVVAVDIRTGEKLWTRNWDNKTLDFGQLFYWDSYNLHGAYPFLWETTGRTWRAFDDTGRWVYTMENVPSGTRVRGPKGEIFIYTIDLADGWISLWNSSRVVSSEGSWNPHGRVYEDANELGFEWNVSIPTNLPGSVNAVLEDRIIGTSTSSRTYQLVTTGRTDIPISLWGISLKEGQQGTMLFNTEWQPPAGNYSIQWGVASAEDGVFTLWNKEARQHIGFSAETGAYRWTTESQHYLDAFGARINIRLGRLYCTGFAGIVYAYNLANGNVVWEYNVNDPYTEILWGENWPMLFAFYTADRKIVLFHMEHSPIDPLPRGAPTICLDADTGDLEWELNMRGNRWGGHNVIGDGIIGFFNTYDNRIYGIGKGPSATSVMASPKVTNLGSSVLLEGRVTDVSAGTKKDEIVARFPDGVPAVSDASMSEWMSYVYMQFERPTNVEGIQVKIEIVDPNNEYAWIGTATTDAFGNYAYSFIPQIKGKYMIMASFDGSGGYWGSIAVTYITVDPAPAPYPTIPGYQGPSAQDVAQNVVNSLPVNPTPDQISQAVIAQMPEFPEMPAVTIPEYTTIDIVIIVAVVAVAVLVVYTLITVKKQK